MKFSQVYRIFALATFVYAAESTQSVRADELSLDSQRARFRVAYEAAQRGVGEWARLAIGLDTYPLYPYIGLASLKRRLPKLSRAEVEQFLDRWPDTLPERDLRNAYLRQVADRGDWKTFRELYRPGSDRTLRCNELRAQLAAGDRPDYALDIEPLWMTANPSPSACDPVFVWARASDKLDDGALWTRIGMAAAEGRDETIIALVPLLAESDRDAARRIATAVRDPAATLAKTDDWKDDARSRDAVAFGLARYARRDSAASETLWASLQSRFKFDKDQKNRVLNALAIYRSTSYSPDAIARLDALPADAADDTSREWHVRVALATQDWKETLSALDDLSAEQKSDPRWRYLRARVLAKLDRKAEADKVFRSIARVPGFYGFLAADWISEPYAICPRTLSNDVAADAALMKQPDLGRAFEFQSLRMLPEARREWSFAQEKLNTAGRERAANLAFKRGWYDRAVYLYSAAEDTQRYYEQRFPLAMESRVRRESRDAGIDPAWAYAIIRAESAWTTDARSGANAYGLMQLLPGVAKQLAKSEKLPYSRPSDLFEPGLNIQLGTRYLGQMADKYDGSPWLASAAYNAGSAPVGRWLDARGTLDPDFFIETIPYRETREYVSRVLAFSVIYDWRINGKVVPLASRLPKFGQTYHAPTDDTPRKAVVCDAPETTKIASNAP